MHDLVRGPRSAHPEPAREWDRDVRLVRVAKLNEATWIPGLEEACKLYQEGSLSGGELFASMAKAGLPKALIEVMVTLHDTSVEHHKLKTSGC